MIARTTHLLAKIRVQTTSFTVRTVTQLSYVKGANTPPISNETLPSFYERELLAKFAPRPALVSRHEPSPNSGYLRWSYEELWKQANDLARGLLGLGVTKGSRVGVVMGNSRYDGCFPSKMSYFTHGYYWDSAYAQLQWACSIIGAISVTINPAYRVHELVSRHPECQVPILNAYIADEDVKPCRSFALVPGSEYPNVEVSEFVGRSMP